MPPRSETAAEVPTPTGTERYALKRLLAQGGLGQVWLVYDRQLQRDVALKQVLGKWADTPKVVDQLRQEAIITGQLEHPGIVPVHDVGQDENGQLFYCMKLVQGNTFRETITFWSTLRRGLAREDQRRRIFAAFIAVCDAMAYAHSRGVLHLDLKPENVILGDYGETQILDWGLAKLLSHADGPANGRLMRGVVGTPRYMAPEQIAGNEESLAPATDVYSLGVMLTEIALYDTGHELPRLEREKLEESPAQVRQAIRKLRGPIRAICRKATAEEPSQRYQDARQLAIEVQRYLVGDRVHAHREGVIAKFRRFTNKQKTFVTAAAVTLIVFAGWWLDRRIHEESDLQTAKAAQAQAVVAWEQGDVNRSLDSLRSALDRLGRYSSARHLVERWQQDFQALSHWRDFDLALREARLLSGDPGRTRDALQAISRARELAASELPGDYQAEGHRQQRLEAMAELDLLESWLNRKSEASFSAVANDSKSYLVGRAHQLAGRIEEAATAFERRLVEAPDDFWAMYFLADCHEKLGHKQLAAAEYTACLAQEPLYAFLYVNRGNVLQSMGRKDEALADYRRAEKLRGSDAKPAHNQGVLLSNAGRWGEAVKEFDRALEITPESVDSLVHRARALRQLGKFEESRVDLEKALLLEPDSAAAHSGIAFLYRELKRPVEAQQAADRATALNGTLATAPWIRGLILADRQQWQPAADAFRDAIDIEPENAALRNNRADALLAIGQPAAAIAELDHALALDPDFQLARWNRIRSQILLRNTEAIVTDLRHLGPPATENEAYDQAQRYANTCLNASQQLDPAAARPIVDHCLSAIAAIVKERDQLFAQRLMETPSIARLSRNPTSREKIFVEHLP